MWVGEQVLAGDYRRDLQILVIYVAVDELSELVEGESHGAEDDEEPHDAQDEELGVEDSFHSANVRVVAEIL